MRIGIFSDVHGNLEALEEVLRAYEGRCVDKYVCLGDIVGYGSQPNECCELVREYASLSIMGNHDAAVVGIMDYSYYYEAARRALDWCREHLTSENLEWLATLPFQQKDPSLPEVGYSHGSPLEPEVFDYVFAVEQARELLSNSNCLRKVNFIGHSHLCKSFVLRGGHAFDVVGPMFSVQPDCSYIVTVGSVGQPRDLDSRACAGIYDTGKGTFEYLRVEYDVEAAARKILEANLSMDFAKRLFLGV